MSSERERPAAEWQRDQMRFDDEGRDPLPPEAEDEAAPGADAGRPGEDVRDWNKGQMAFDDGQEGERWRDPDEMPPSESGFSGGRSNPGGGQRFGKFDERKRDSDERK